jgi:universal stress protein E
MLAPRRILVAIKDPRARSLPALAKAAQLAHAYGAELELFHGIAEPVSVDPFLYIDGGLANHERQTRSYYLEALARLAAPLTRKGLTVNVSAAWDFPVYEAIVRRARQVKADLIVAECHAGMRLTPWLLHVTDWELLRTSPVPVLLVKSARPWKRPLVLAALDPAHAFAKPAKLDKFIVDAASSMAHALRGSMHAMHAYQPLPIGTVSWNGTSAEVLNQIAADSEKRARTAFERSLKASKLPRAKRHLVEGVPVEALPRTARKLGSDIVVMGAISRSGLKRALIGNTAERVLHELTCDVLVVKPATFKARVARAGRGVRYVGAPRVPMAY